MKPVEPADRLTAGLALAHSLPQSAAHVVHRGSAHVPPVVVHFSWFASDECLIGAVEIGDAICVSPTPLTPRDSICCPAICYAGKAVSSLKNAPRAFRRSLSMSRARRRLLELSDFHVSYERAVPFCIFLKSMKKFILDAQSTFSPNLIGVPLAQSKFSLMNTG